MPVRVEKLSKTDEFAECEEVQKTVWGFGDISVVPRNTLIAIQQYGGLVLGAFEDSKMVGVLIGFLARYQDGRTCHYSQRTAVIREMRGLNVGLLLKTAQRRYVAEQGLDLIIWTYDPLEGVNSSFNFRKLGGIGRTYKRNFFGNMEDRLNAGLESDRLVVEWWINSQRVRGRIEEGPHPPAMAAHTLGMVPIANPTEPELNGFCRVIEVRRGLVGEPKLLAEIPESIQALKSHDMGLAAHWRLRVRELLEYFFRSGYVISDSFSVFDGGERRNFLVLNNCGSSMEGLLQEP